MSWKIIRTSNFCLDDVSDALVCDNITVENYGKCIVSALNDKYSGDFAKYHFYLADSSKDLYIYNP
jgi:hypothetical protein